MKASELAEKRRQIEESLLKNDRERQNFLQKNPHYLNELGQLSSSSISDSISSSRIQNDSDIFQQKAQRFNTVKTAVNNEKSDQKRNIGDDKFDGNESIHELIEEHMPAKRDQPLNMDSSSDLEYSQSHQVQRKANNSILKKQQINNSSGIEEFSFQNNFGLDNSNVKISNIFLNTNTHTQNNVNSSNNLQSILRSDHAFMSNNLLDENHNQNDNKNNYLSNQYHFNRDSDYNNNNNNINNNNNNNNNNSSHFQRDSEGALYRIEEEKNSQQNFYSQRQQNSPYNHQYQLSSSSSRKGVLNSLIGNELVQSSQQTLQNKNIQNNERIPNYSHNSQNENINYLNYSNSAAQRQPQWTISQSLYQQHPSSQINSNILYPPSVNDNSYQSSLLLQNQMPANNSSIENSSSLRANYPYNQPTSSNNLAKDLEFFRLNRDKKEVELPNDMKTQYEKIYEMQISPNKNEVASFMRQPSPYQQYSQSIHEKQQALLSHQKQQIDYSSLQNSQRRENNFLNSYRSNEYPIQIKNSDNKSPSRYEESTGRLTSQYETQRNKYEQVLENHVRKYSPHSRTQTVQYNSPNKEKLGNSKSFQMTHLQGIYDTYQGDQSHLSPSSSSSSSSDESLQSSMGHSVKIQIQKEIAKQKRTKQKAENQQRQQDSKNQLQQYLSNQSDRSNNSNAQFVNQMEEDMNLMRTQFVPQTPVVAESNEEEDEEEEQEQQEEEEQDDKEELNKEQQDSYHEMNDNQQFNEEDGDHQIYENNNQDKQNNQKYEDDQKHNDLEDEQDNQQTDQLNDSYDESHQMYENEGSLDNIQQNKKMKHKNLNKHPTLQTIENTFDNDNQNNKQKGSYQKYNSLADVQKYKGQEINSKDWNKYNNQNQQESERKQTLQEIQDEYDQLEQREDEEQVFQIQHDHAQDEQNYFKIGDDNQNQNQDDQQEDLEQVNDIDEYQILNMIDELFQAISHEKDTEHDEEKRHQYELLQIRLMNLMPQDKVESKLEDEEERNQLMENQIEDLIDIKRLFLQILVSKQGKQQNLDANNELKPSQDYGEHILNLVKQLKVLEQKLKELVRKRKVLQKQFSKKISQIGSKDNFDVHERAGIYDELNDSMNSHDIFDQSRKNSNAGKSFMELNAFIQKQKDEYLQHEEDFLNQMNTNFQLDQDNYENQDESANKNNNDNEIEENKNNEKTQSRDNIKQEQDMHQISDILQEDAQNKQNLDEDEEKLTHNDLIQILDRNYNNKNSSTELPPITSKAKIQENQNDLSIESAVNEELEQQVQKIRQNTQLKKEIQNMLKDKSDIIEKFKYRLEMRLNNEGDQNGKKSPLDDVDLSFQSEMKYEESLKQSSLLKEQNKKKQSYGYCRKGSNDNSERSAPANLNNNDNVQGDESFQNEKSELDKTLQEKLKHELFLDLENFRRSDVFRTLNNRKIKDLLQRYIHQKLSEQVSALARGMSVIANAKEFLLKKQTNIKQNSFNVIKWYSDYSQVKNHNKMQAEQNIKLKNLQTKSNAFYKIQKFCAQHKKWIEAIQENNKMMKLYRIITEWKKIVNYKAMKQQADLYYKNTLFQKFKSNIYEIKNSVDIRALMHYSNKIQNQYFTLFCQTARELRRKRIAIDNKVSKINKDLLTTTFTEWRAFAQLKRQEKNEYIPIQICIKDTISKPKMKPNQTLKDYKRVPITTSKTIRVILPPDSAFKF